MSEVELNRAGIPRPSAKPGEEVRRLARYLTEDGGVKELVQGLEALQISCYNHPENDGLLEKKYARFLEVLALYTAFHKQERHSESSNRLIWVCDVYQACGGLADRVKGVTYALLLAMLTQRVLILNWRDREFGEQDFLQPNTIDWRFSEQDQDAAYSYSYKDVNNVSYAAYNSNQEYGDHVYQDGDRAAGGIQSLHLFSILGGIGIDVSADVLKMSLDLIRGRWQWVELESNLEPSSLLNDTKTASSSWIKQGMASLGLSQLSPEDVDGLVGLVFRYLFTFSGQLLAELDDARQVLGLDNQKYVGVHIRTGFLGSKQQESVKHPKLFRSIQQWEKTLSCAYRSATERLGSSALLFLAADSNLVKNRTLDMHRFKGRFRSLDNSVVHLDRLEKTPHDAEEFETEGVLSTWIDLVLLAESNILVRGKSGFSLLAGHLCFIPKTKVISALKCV